MKKIFILFIFLNVALLFGCSSDSPNETAKDITPAPGFSPDDPTLTPPDLDGDGIPDSSDDDRDGDGISNDDETQLGFDPNNANSTPPDADGDNTPDALDNDRDGDGTDNAQDAFPNNAAEWSDIDKDGIGDNADPDRDGDNINNNDETQLGFDPNDPLSKPTDLDQDRIPDALDDDRDGDGEPNSTDTYPDDASRNALAAVQGIQAQPQNTQVELTWQALTDTQNVSGYHLYRTVQGSTTSIKLTTTPISGLSYSDTTVNNGTGYVYTVVAIDNNAKEGTPSEPTNLFVAYNITPASGLTATRVAANTQLNWSTEVGFTYRIYRAISGQETQAIADSTNNFLDTQAIWHQAYDYQIATLVTFINPFTNQPLEKTGPKSPIASIDALILPALQIKLTGATQRTANTYELVIDKQQHIKLSGTLINPIARINITASNGEETLTTTSETGTFQLILPITEQLTWQITARETQMVDQTAALQLRLSYDTLAPQVSITSPQTPSTNREFIDISGIASDTHTSLVAVHLSSDRYANQQFGVTYGANKQFFGEMPLQVGANLITVTATDKAGNQSTASISITRQIPLAPTVTINTPQTGTTQTAERITVSGTVYSAQPAEQLRLTLGIQQTFPTATNTPGVYHYQFEGIALNEGINTITVLIESPIANNQAQTTVTRQTNSSPTKTAVPVITLTAPLKTTTKETHITLAGHIRSSANLSTLSINNQAALFQSIDGNDKNVSFQHRLDLTQSPSGQVIIIATDINGNNATKTLTMTQDTQAPKITLTNPVLEATPAINLITETPLQLQGHINDENFAGLNINGQSIGVLPAGNNTYTFRAELTLPDNQQTQIDLQAWDQAGNRHTQTYTVQSNLPVAIEIIHPLNNQKIIVSGQTTPIDITARLTGQQPGDRVTASINNGNPQTLTADGNTYSGTISLDAIDGTYRLAINVHNAENTRIATATTALSLINSDNLALALTKITPANGTRGIEPNAFIALHFNKALDPNLLHISVKETVHGKTYDLSGQKGLDPLTAGDTAKLINVNRNLAPVNGGISTFPDSRLLAYYPKQDFAYGAQIFVDVSYNNQPLQRLSFHVRPLPTFIQGFVSDQLLQPIAGLQVSLKGRPKENPRTAITNSDGLFSFGFGDRADQTLPGGRQNLVINPHNKNPAFASTEQWINIEPGRLRKLGNFIVPILDSNIPYRQINSHQSQAILASGELIIDLTETQLHFPNGQNSGQVHVQMIPTETLSHASEPMATGHWVFATQPSGIATSTIKQITFTMPPRLGSYQYIPADGALVLIVGFNANTKQMLPTGVGRIKQRKVISEGPLHITHLDYLGYVLKNAEEQNIMQRYINDELSLIEMVSELNSAGN